jgi:outer membrane protein TolC
MPEHGPLPRGKWWELYGDAKLNELEEQVDPSNQTLKIAEANFRQARTAIRFNRAAEAPTIGTSPSLSAVRSSANQPYFPPSLANNGSGDFTLLGFADCSSRICIKQPENLKILTFDRL